MESANFEHFKAEVWDAIVVGTLYGSAKQETMHFFDKLLTGLVFERNALQFQTETGSVAITPRNFNKRDILAKLFTSSPMFMAVFDAVWDKPHNGSTWGLSLFQDIYNRARESTIVSNVKSDNEVHQIDLTYRQFVKPHLCRRIHIAGGDAAEYLVSGFRHSENGDSEDTTGIYKQQDKGQHISRILQYLTQYTWTEAQYKLVEEALPAMGCETVLEFVQLSVDKLESDREQWVSSTIPIISHDPKEFAFGRIKEFDVSEVLSAEGVWAWDEFEAKFEEPKMVKWWRCWVGQLFDDKFATGRVINGMTQTGNLGICVIRSTGGQGSSSVLSVIESRIGENLTTAARLSGDHFEQRSYYGKRLAIKDDGKEKRILFRGNVHSMVTGAKQSIEGKGRNAFTSFINCGVLMSMNYPLVVNTSAADQMRRLVYVVLKKKSDGKRTADWKEALNRQFPAYLRQCRETLAEVRVEADNVEDIFSGFDDDIINHYAAFCDSEPLGRATEILLNQGFIYGEGGTCTIEGVTYLLQKFAKSIGAKMDSMDIAVRQLENDPRIKRHGSKILGAKIGITWQKLRDIVLQADYGDSDESGYDGNDYGDE